MKKAKCEAAAQRRPAKSERKNRVFSAKRQAVCGDVLYQALEQAVSGVMGQEEDEPALVREGDMARISFEGLYFPVEDVVQALREHLTPTMQGKLDYLDLEDWRLTRYQLEAGEVHPSSAPLNNVLAFSGH